MATQQELALFLDCKEEEGGRRATQIKKEGGDREGEWKPENRTSVQRAIVKQQELDSFSFCKILI